MKIVYALCTLVLCFMSVACSTHELTDDSLTSAYAWLDTPPRSHMRKTRPQSTITQWKKGLPPARDESVAISVPSLNRIRHEQRGGSDFSHQRNASPGYFQGYRTSYSGRSRRHNQNCDTRGVSQRQGLVRKVEKVGPSIVPQLSSPLSTRSYSGGPRILPAKGVAIVPVPVPEVSVMWKIELTMADATQQGIGLSGGVRILPITQAWLVNKRK